MGGEEGEWEETGEWMGESIAHQMKLKNLPLMKFLPFKQLSSTNMLLAINTSYTIG